MKLRRFLTLSILLSSIGLFAQEKPNIKHGISFESGFYQNVNQTDLSINYKTYFLSERLNYHLNLDDKWEMKLGAGWGYMNETNNYSLTLRSSSFSDFYHMYSIPYNLVVSSFQTSLSFVRFFPISDKFNLSLEAGLNADREIKIERTLEPNPLFSDLGYELGDEEYKFVLDPSGNGDITVVPYTPKEEKETTRFSAIGKLQLSYQLNSSFTLSGGMGYYFDFKSPRGLYGAFNSDANPHVRLGGQIGIRYFLK